MNKKKVADKAKHIENVIITLHTLTGLRELLAIEKSILRGELAIQKELKKKLKQNRDEIRAYKAYVRAYEKAIKLKQKSKIDVDDLLLAAQVYPGKKK